jgi:hypothetical protein
MEIHLPIKGINEGIAVDKSPPVTSGDLNNVRPTDVLEGRLRMGQRPGVDKWGDGDQIGAVPSPTVYILSVTVID